MRLTSNNAPEVRDLIATVMVSMINGATGEAGLRAPGGGGAGLQPAEARTSVPLLPHAVHREAQAEARGRRASRKRNVRDARAPDARGAWGVARLVRRVAVRGAERPARLVGEGAAHGLREASGRGNAEEEEEPADAEVHAARHPRPGARGGVGQGLRGRLREVRPRHGPRHGRAGRPAPCRGRGDCENVFDEMKNQWGWGGFTAHSIAQTALFAGLSVIAANLSNIFTRLGGDGSHRETATSRPLLQSCIALPHAPREAGRHNHLHDRERKGAGNLPRDQRVPREGRICVAVGRRAAAPADCRVRITQVRHRQAPLPAPHRTADAPSAPLSRKNRGETPPQPANLNWRGDTPLTSTAIFRINRIHPLSVSSYSHPAILFRTNQSNMTFISTL